MRVVALDIIRFVAAMAVVLYHYFFCHSPELYPALDAVVKYGYLGVPLFFIISGYVIAMSAQQRSASEFAIARFVRLYPTLWICILLTVLLAGFAGNSFSPAQIMANMTLLHPYLGFNHIDGVYWTLIEELKFYALVFLLLCFGIFERYRIWLSLWLIVTVLYAITGQPAKMGWFISPGYSSFFIAGIAFYLMQKEGRNSFNVSVALISLLLSTFSSFERTSAFLVAPTLREQWISVVIVWSFYILFYQLARGKLPLPQWRLFSLMGALTYPLYLIHNSVVQVLLNWQIDLIPYGLQLILAIGVALLLSFLIHRFLATPLSLLVKNVLNGSRQLLLLRFRPRPDEANSL